MVWYLAAPEHRLGWIRVDRLLGEHGTGQDSASGELHREIAEQKANRISAQEMPPLGWTEAELISPLMNDSGKLATAARVRKETTLPIKRIAARMHSPTDSADEANR